MSLFNPNKTEEDSKQDPVPDCDQKVLEEGNITGPTVVEELPALGEHLVKNLADFNEKFAHCAVKPIKHYNGEFFYGGYKIYPGFDFTNPKRHPDDPLYGMKPADLDEVED